MSFFVIHSKVFIPYSPTKYGLTSIPLVHLFSEEVTPFEFYSKIELGFIFEKTL